MSFIPSPCCAVSKNQAGRMFGAPATTFIRWWMLSMYTAGRSDVPSSTPPDTSLSFTSSRCSWLVTSNRSVMMS